MSLRLASFAALAALATVVASGACTSTITLVDTTSTTSAGAGGGSSSAGTGGGSSSAGTTGSGTGGPCSDKCPAEGAPRCTGNALQICSRVGSCLDWSINIPCPANQTCDNTGTACIDTAIVCDDSSECGCGCGCAAHQCVCAGGLPPTCAVDTDCGPVCTGFHCVAQQCVPPGCVDPCPSAGATRCVGGAIETCTQNGACLAWSAGVACPSGQICNNTATKCVTSPDICNDSSECACNCPCTANECSCIPPFIPVDCTTDADCGPLCSGLVCVGKKCVVK